MYVIISTFERCVNVYFLLFLTILSYNFFFLVPFFLKNFFSCELFFSLGFYFHLRLGLNLISSRENIHLILILVRNFHRISVNLGCKPTGGLISDSSSPGRIFLSIVSLIISLQTNSIAWQGLFLVHLYTLDVVLCGPSFTQQ